MDSKPVEFLFDTADLDYIDFTWMQLSGLVPPTAVKGITTNPNALSKVEAHTLDDVEKTVRKLVTAVSDMRGGEPGGAVHVQIPNSNLCLSEDHTLKWAEYVSDFGDGVTHIVLKIPHFTAALKLADKINHQIGMPVNVTGISDWGTIVKSFAFPGVTYASLIVGRMAEVEIDVDETLMYLAGIPRQGIQKIIAGSMRTVSGLNNAVYANCLPTIGQRVWDLYHNEEENTWESFVEIWDYSLDPSLFEMDVHWPPMVSEANRKLTEAFFNQMDELGSQTLSDFVDLVNTKDEAVPEMVE